jgi:hypothetical protein
MQQPVCVVRLVEVQRRRDLSLAEIERVADDLPALGTKLVLFSGGEPLLRPEVFDAAARFRGNGITLHLHTSGVLLERCAPDVARMFRASSCRSTPRPSGSIRPCAAWRAAGARARRRPAAASRPEIPITARATLHRLNFRELPRLIEHARAMALDGISFRGGRLVECVRARYRRGRLARAHAGRDRRIRRHRRRDD